MSRILVLGRLMQEDHHNLGLHKFQASLDFCVRTSLKKIQRRKEERKKKERNEGCFCPKYCYLLI